MRNLCNHKQQKKHVYQEFALIIRVVINDVLTLYAMGKARYINLEFRHLLKESYVLRKKLHRKDNLLKYCKKSQWFNHWLVKKIKLIIQYSGLPRTFIEFIRVAQLRWWLR